MLISRCSYHSSRWSYNSSLDPLLFQYFTPTTVNMLVRCSHSIKLHSFFSFSSSSHHRYNTCPSYLSRCWGCSSQPAFENAYGLSSDSVGITMDYLWLSRASIWKAWHCFEGCAWWLSVDLLRSNQISVGLLGISQNQVWNIYSWIRCAFEWSVKLLRVKSRYLCLPVPYLQWNLRFLWVIHWNIFGKASWCIWGATWICTVVYHFILSLQRLLPCLRSLPQFCYLKIVCQE
jgi:hypothetical protein